MSQDSLVALRQVSILAKLTTEGLERVARAATWRQCDSGEQLLGYQDATTDVYFLTAGKVRVIIYSSEGKVVVFRDLRAPAMFGEIAAIDRGPRSASIEVVEACTVASLSAAEFERLLLREPTVAVATLRHITAEVRKLSERVVEFSTLLVSNRIHAELLRLVTEAEQQTGEPLLSPAPSLADIANRVSSHREAVSRELSRLGALGLIRREGTNLRVLDRARLEALVRDARGD